MPMWLSKYALTRACRIEKEIPVCFARIRALYETTLKTTRHKCLSDTGSTVRLALQFL